MSQPIAWKSFEEGKKRMAENREKIRLMAETQRLVLVKFSERRYLIIHLDSGSTPVWADKNQKYRTNMSGRIAFGPATFNACKDWIAEYDALTIPPELVGI